MTHRFNRFIIVTLLLLLAPLQTGAQDASGIKTANLKDADLALMTNHDPEVERQNFELLPGYEVNLFASEPMLANPIHMTWDSRGRLWVACSWAYPQLKPGEVANDKIIILEDTDGDGRADKSTIFAEGLYMPTGIELANGGCYVAQTPDVFFLKDTDGDDVADVKELALTGFGIEDSHHSASAWRRGPGGWLYFQEGIFLHAQVETQYGVVRNYNGGVYQFNPRTQDLRVFAKIGVGNPWGHVFDRWGQSFLVDNPRVGYLTPTTGNSGDKINMPVLIKTEKQCGGDIASGTHLPEDIRGQLLTCRFKSRAIVRYEFLENGAGYSSNVLEPLIASKHPNFRPVDCKIGPDGAVYVADWYNSIINHAQHDFRDDRRDHSHGRIWRITAKDRPLVKKPNLHEADIAALLDHLKSPEEWVRHQARQELSLRDTVQVARAAEAWVDQLDPNDPEHDHHLVEAMWACQNIEHPSPKILEKVLTAKDGRARAAGARVIRYWYESLADPIGVIRRAANDPFPRTRLEAVLSAGYVPLATAYPAALSALDHKQDEFIDLALPQTTRALQNYWQPALQNGKLTFDKPEHQAYAEREAGLGFDRRLAAFLKNKKATIDEITSVTNEFRKSANPKQVLAAIAALSKKRLSISKSAAVALLGALQEIGRQGAMDMANKADALQVHLKGDDDLATLAAANLGVWKVYDAAPQLAATLRDANRSIEVRSAAATALGTLGRPENTSVLKKLAAESDMVTRYLSVQGLAAGDLTEAAREAAVLVGVDPGEGDPTALVREFIQRNHGANELAKALENASIHPAVIKSIAEFQRQTGQFPKALAQVFQPQSTGSLSALLLGENRKQLTLDVERYGDPASGEMIYRRQGFACTTCHGIGSVGPAIGPNLVAVGAAATTEYIVESILEPNKAIAEHYENVMLTTQTDSVHMGVITFKSKDEIAIRDSMQAGREVRLATAAIKKTTPMPSLMPAGLADQLASRQEFLDVTRFVSLLGRPGAYANDERPVIRRWQVAARKPGAAPNAQAAWVTAYSVVSGELPDGDLDLGPSVWAQAEIDVQVAGAISLLINNTAGLQLWIDGRAITTLTKPLDLAKGLHTLTFAVDRATRNGQGLQVELQSPAGSGAKFRPVGGI